MRFIKVLAITALYLASARLGLMLAFQHTNVSPVWPPTGIAIAAILLFGYEIWPGILIGAFLANFTTGLPVHVSAIISVGNTFEAICGGWLIVKFTGKKNPFEAAKDTLWFILASALCTLVSATIGTTAIHFSKYGSGASYVFLWGTWWLADTVGAIVVTPFVVSWYRKIEVGSLNTIVEAIVITSLLLGISLLVFSGWTEIGETLTYATVPIVALAAFRFEQRGASASLLGLSTLAVLGTIAGHGPFSEHGQHESLLILQGFIGVIAVTALPVAAIVTERKKAEQLNLDQIYEKEVLLQEIHHRVKNNLQIISSLLNMQLRNSDPVVRALLIESRNRIQSMAMIHERLYESANFARINLGPYLKELVNHILTTYGSEKQIVDLQIECDDASLGIDKAVPVGLIVNEIITNSMLHAFENRENCQIRVKLKCPDGRTTLDISDNGNGLPKEIDLQHGSMGLKLIGILAKQLHADIQIDRSAGTRFVLEF
jgi:two-component sensor histidine kinase/integral membrane sensor domain MASE1